MKTKKPTLKQVQAIPLPDGKKIVKYRTTTKIYFDLEK
jgi:hypothetical protein